MVFNWSDYFTFAKSVHSKRNDTEVMRRAAISRAYYSVYNPCLEYAKKAKDDPLSPPTTGRLAQHRELYVWFKNNRYRTNDERIVGDNLQKLHRSRSISDYDSAEEITTGDLRHVINQAEEIKNLLKI